jgi:hypothetical protein
MAVIVTVTVFWDVTPCDLIEIYQRSEEYAASIFGDMEAAHTKLRLATTSLRGLLVREFDPF